MNFRDTEKVILSIATGIVFIIGFGIGVQLYISLFLDRLRQMLEKAGRLTQRSHIYV